MKYLLISTLSILMIISGSACNSSEKPIRIAFWNLENLYDTINAPDVLDNEFTPKGFQKWDTEKYNKKVERICQVIAQINPSIMGFCEVENENVVKDILPTGYKYVHYDSPDSRGIDVALIYDPKKITVTNSEPIKASGEHKTRYILRVDVTISEGGSTKDISIFVAHLPSRRTNNAEIREQREAINHQLDSVSTLAANTIIMGDMNQNPHKGFVPKLWNTTLATYRSGKGSYAYRDTWQMYDQIFVSFPMRTEVQIHTKGLIQESGRFRGYPKKGDPSDHLPIYIDLK